MNNNIQLHPNITHSHYKVIDSTNSFLMQYSQPVNQLVSAERQTEGKGRRKQKWVDDKGSLLFSLSTGFKPEFDVSSWPIQVAIIVVETILKLTNQQIKIKWPNDIYTQNNNIFGKCAGILVESNIGKSAKMVTGIGLNLAPIKKTIDSDYPISYLSLGKSKKFILFSLANSLYKAWESFLKKPYIKTDIFSKYDYLAGNMIIATDTNTNYELIGKASGVNSKGHLLIEKYGKITELTSQQKIRLI